ncbi:DUF2850 domain-containing protein [Vibrio astriarenae]|uniref:DUF2850 domain-containing protein n=1 Tax=Vibrio astriarenae TaxID=1481923 RepID=UPI003735A9D8
MSNEKASKRKAIERILIAFAVVTSLIAGALYLDLYGRMQESKYPKETVFGTWVEMEVANHVQDRFTLSEVGVMRRGRVVATDFVFTGRHLEFKEGDRMVRYRMLNMEDTEMILDSDALYTPTYRNIERYSNELR